MSRKIVLLACSVAFAASLSRLSPPTWPSRAAAPAPVVVAPAFDPSRPWWKSSRCRSRSSAASSTPSCRRRLRPGGRQALTRFGSAAATCARRR